MAPPNSSEAVCSRVLASEEGDYFLTKKQAEFQMPIIPISNDSVETKIETTPIFNSNTFNKIKASTLANKKIPTLQDSEKRQSIKKKERKK